jgi:hypothetical protein
MTTAGKGRTLWHGTTRRRAEAILRDSPDPDFLEPGGFDPAGGFSTASPLGPYDFGDPRVVAAGKAALFPEEGDPAILEIEVPEEIVALAVDLGTEIRFQQGYGLEELCDAWATLPKRILL